MSIIERVRTHYRKSGGRIEVPEWEDDATGEATVLVFDPLTIEERMRLSRVGNKEGELEMSVSMVLLKCKTEDGLPAFKPEDRVDLKRSADSAIISRIVGAITSLNNDDALEEAEKN